MPWQYLAFSVFFENFKNCNDNFKNQKLPWQESNDFSMIRELNLPSFDNYISHLPWKFKKIIQWDGKFKKKCIIQYMFSSESFSLNEKQLWLLHIPFQLNYRWCCSTKMTTNSKNPFPHYRFSAHSLINPATNHLFSSRNS